MTLKIYLYVTFLITAIGIYIHHLINKPTIELCQIENCPNCYGSNLCEHFKQNRVILEYVNFVEAFSNLIGVKNVFFARFNNTRVVLKKLGHSSELKEIVKVKAEVEAVEKFVDSSSSVKSFKTCSRETTKRFIYESLERFQIEEIATMIQINVEPLILNLYKSENNWAVPRFYGACGMIIVEENSGMTLNYAENFSWLKRAFIAKQLLEAAQNFTRNHHEFRLYLTDISPDNIAVDANTKIRFIDLENVIISLKDNTGTIYYSEHFSDEAFAYSESQICDNAISDHNIYAICRLLLSKNAPWPMMKHGLLHSAPRDIKSNYSNLFKLVEDCVYSEERSNRFDIAVEIIQILTEILVVKSFFE